MRISRNQKSIALSVALICGTLFFCFMILLPFLEKYHKSLEKIQKVNKDREIVMGAVNSIPQMRHEKNRNDKDLIYLNSRLPQVDKVPEIIRQISDKTDHLNLNVLSIASGDQFQLEGKPVTARTIFIDLQAQYQALAEYLSLIETIETALAIKKIHISKSDKLTPPQLSVNVQVETYIAGNLATETA